MKTGMWIWVVASVGVVAIGCSGGNGKGNGSPSGDCDPGSFPGTVSITTTTAGQSSGTTAVIGCGRLMNGVYTQNGSQETVVGFSAHGLNLGAGVPVPDSNDPPDFVLELPDTGATVAAGTYAVLGSGSVPVEGGSNVIYETQMFVGGAASCEQALGSAGSITVTSATAKSVHGTFAAPRLCEDPTTTIFSSVTGTFDLDMP